MVGNTPVLVRFEGSVVPSAVAGASSPVSRPSKMQALVSRLIFGGSPRSSVMLTRLATELSHRSAPVVVIVGGAERGFGYEALDELDAGVVSFDIYATEFVDFIADGHEIPLKNESVDAVVVQAVLEHVLDPKAVVDEIHRVLRRGGLVYAETPFMQQVHEGAYDFTRFTERGHRWLFRSFEQIESGALRGAGTALLWSIRYFIASLVGSKRLAALVCLPIAWLRLLDRAARPGFDVDSAADVYFFGRKSDRNEISRHMLIDGYQGAQR